MQIDAAWGEAKFGFSTAERNLDPPYAIPFSVWDSGHIALEIAIRLNQTMMEENGDRITSDIVCASPRTNVQNIHVTHPPFSSHFWRRVLGHFQSLRHMKLRDGYMPDLSILACTDISAREDAENWVGHALSDHRSHVLVPVLEELGLDGITFSPGGDSDMAVQPAITYQCLVVTLSTRIQGRLTITGCKIGRSDKPESLDYISNVVRSWGDANINLPGNDFIPTIVELPE